MTYGLRITASYNEIFYIDIISCSFVFPPSIIFYFVTLFQGLNIAQTFVCATIRTSSEIKALRVA